ncbi:MAG TPA: NUDIX domain-containing protein [Hyphomicrobiaceae bacterium]|nr:NUDIX domain-containing protein [Hyphomicrobiaceae bacterium]
MVQRSAGILLYEKRDREVRVLLVHPGGPFWTKKDAGAWTIPKGTIEPGENPLACARREFEEETGFAPEGEFLPLGGFRQSSAKTVEVWALEGYFDVTRLSSCLFTMEWPPRSGREQAFPEVDRAAWFTIEEAVQKILKGQQPILRALLEKIGC